MHNSCENVDTLFVGILDKLLLESEGAWYFPYRCLYQTRSCSYNEAKKKNHKNYRFLFSSVDFTNVSYYSVVSDILYSDFLFSKKIHTIYEVYKNNAALLSHI